MKYFSKAILLAGLLVVSGAPLSATSLWGRPGVGETSMFADRKAHRVGDILTVRVTETFTQSLSLQTDSEKTTGNEAGITSFLFPSSNFGTHGGEKPSIGWDSTNTFETDGQINNSQDVRTLFSVLVIDILPNRNLVVEGRRLVEVSGEKQYAVLRGIVRTEDIDSSNTVPSSRIADASVQFLSEGALSEAKKRGWLTRFYDWASPF